MLYINSTSIKPGLGGGCPFLPGQYSIARKLPLWQSRSPHTWCLAGMSSEAGPPAGREGEWRRKGKAREAQGEGERETCSPAFLSNPREQHHGHLINSHLSSPPSWLPPTQASCVPSPSAENCSQKGANEVWWGRRPRSLGLSSETSELRQAMSLSGPLSVSSSVKWNNDQVHFPKYQTANEVMYFQ